MASEELPWLCKVEISANGSLENFAKLAAKLAAKLDYAELIDGSEVLIGLLEAFIGEALTLRLLHDLWPDLPSHDNFSQGNSAAQGSHEFVGAEGAVSAENVALFKAVQKLAVDGRVVCSPSTKSSQPPWAWVSTPMMPITGKPQPGFWVEGWGAAVDAFYSVATVGVLGADAGFKMLVDAVRDAAHEG